MVFTMTPTQDAKWRPLYAHIRTLPYGTLITYKEMRDLLGFDSRDQQRWSVYRTDKELQRLDSKALINLRNVGYRVAHPEEHLDIVNSRRKRARRQTSKGVMAGLATDLSLINDPDVRDAITRLTTHMRGVEARLTYAERKVAKHEETLKSLQRESKESTAQMDDRISKLEALMKKDDPEDSDA